MFFKYILTWVFDIFKQFYKKQKTMNTIKDLAKQYWGELSLAKQNYLLIQYNISSQDTPYWDAVENIFYNEVVVKWFQNSYYSKITDSKEGYKANLLQAQDIKEMYLKEHTKEQPKNVFDNIPDELINTDFEGIEEEHNIVIKQPQLVDNTIEFDKWLENKKQRYLESKEECYNDILSSTTSAIDQYLKSPYQAQKGVLESAVKCNEMFLDFCEQQPKAIEDNDVWENVFQHYGKPFISGRDLWDFLKQHYSLIKK